MKYPRRAPPRANEVILAEGDTDSVVSCEMLAIHKMLPTKAKLDIRNDRQEDDVAQPASTVERGSGANNNKKEIGRQYMIIIHESNGNILFC